ncbi:RNA polymerase sigma factor [Labilithrix luteola]|uniref:RNA polymerase sigma factor n=1 Tax=Labilithrix luteola TaxID=1391654 RepID=UPI0014729DB0|nr:sigma-70 family RNA polymerase sigma factor [Labilithrix luteola]
MSNLNELDLEVATSQTPRTVTTAELGALFREHVQFIARSLRRLGVPDSDVDDTVQEVFVIASRKLETIARGAERSFLYGTAMRVASNARRVGKRAQVRRVDAPVDEEHPGFDTAPSVEELVDQREARAALDAVLETMTVEMRAVFTLYELEEMTTAEIASLLGVPQGTVSSRLRRAREHFEQHVRAMQARTDREGREP